MDFEKFNNLSDFLHSEFAKFRNLGIKPPAKTLNTLLRSISQHFNLANSISLKEAKFMTKVEWCKFTMPHGKLYRLFHRDLYNRAIKLIEKEQEQEQERKKQLEFEQQKELACISAQAQAVNPEVLPAMIDSHSVTLSANVLTE